MAEAERVMEEARTALRMLGTLGREMGKVHEKILAEVGTLYDFEEEDVDRDILLNASGRGKLDVVKTPGR